mgnify:FL=1
MECIMLNKGYVFLWRKVMDKGYYKKSEYIHLWVHLIMKANHTDTKIFWNSKEIVLKRGQFITGRRILSEETGIKETTIERILKMLENEQQIGQQKTNLFRLITITNYDAMQKVDNKVDNKRTTNGQQTDTNKNDKNDNNEKNDNKKEIYIAIFNQWNSKDIIVHRQLTDKIRRKINTVLQDRTQEEIISAIGNYATVLKSSEYFWTHEWTLIDFLSRGLDKFVEEAHPRTNFLNKDKEEQKEPVIEEEETAEEYYKKNRIEPYYPPSKGQKE